LLDVFQAPLKPSLSLFVVRLQFTNSRQIVAGGSEFLEVFVCESSPEVCFNQNVGAVKVQRPIDNHGGVLDLSLVLLILTVAKGNIIENTSFKLRNFLFEKRELVKRF
jgi:hypothetical protein